MKKLQFNKINVKNDEFISKGNFEINVKGIKPLKSFDFHQAIRDALAYSISMQEVENITLKESIKQLEMDLLLRPFLVEPIFTVSPDLALEDIKDQLKD